MLGTIATQLTTPETRTVSVFVGERDVTGRVDPPKTVIEDGGGKTVTTLRLEGGLAELPEVEEMARVRLVDHASGEVEAFTGYVRSRHPITGLEPVVDLVADGLDTLLDDTYVPVESRPEESDAARIGFFWGKYSGSHLSGDLSKVVQLRAVMPAADYVGLSLRGVLKLIGAQASASAEFYVDPAGRLHYFANEGIPAPFEVVHGTPNATQVAPESFDVDYDANAFFNAVHVEGKTPAASGWFYDHGSIAAHKGLVRSTKLEAPDCETAAMATALANMYLGRVAAGVVRGKFSASSPHDGWRRGQLVLVNDPDHALDAAEFAIARVTTRFEKSGVGLRRKYDVEFGASRAAQRSIGAGGSTGPMVGQRIVGVIGAEGAAGAALGHPNVYLTSDGVSVTDGSTVRAIIGHLGGGVYGVRIVAGDGTVLIDGETINLSKGTGRLAAGVELAIPQARLTADGLEIHDGTIQRAMFGHLGAGVYGAKLVASDGTAVFDGSQLQMSKAIGRLPAGVELGRAETNISAAGMRVRFNTIDRVTLGDLGSGDFGLKVVAEDGATVIVDGKSNMFKIAASGTLSSSTGPNNSSVTLSTTYATGLTSAPMHTGSAAFAFGLLPYIGLMPDLTTVADLIVQHTKVVNTNQTEVQAKYVSPADRSATAWSVKHYIYKEAA